MIFAFLFHARSRCTDHTSAVCLGIASLDVYFVTRHFVAFKTRLILYTRLKVKDDRSIGKDNLLAWACVRLDRLKPGYRFIHLLDATGLPSSGALLVRVSKLVT